MSDEIKYARGVSAIPGTRERSLSRLELITLIHLGVLVIAASWMWGGNIWWARPWLAAWANLGLVLTLSAALDPETRSRGRLAVLHWLWPLLALNAFVLLGVFNPSFREVVDGTRTLWVKRAQVAWPDFPSAARPDRALRALWFFDSIFLAALNLVLIVRQRRAVRGLLIALAVNALALSVFGTVQKLFGSSGPYFGLIKTYQPFFFSSFIYHNHWGAFVVLMTAVSLGLFFHYVRRGSDRGFWQSPAWFWLVALLFLAATLPLSGSRSTTVVAALLLGGAFLHWVGRIIRNRRSHRESAVLPVAGSVAALAVAGWFVYDVARPVVTQRLATTRNQLEAKGPVSYGGSRAKLYADTWRMAQDQPAFGWGMGSYSMVFNLYNSQFHSPTQGPVTYYDDAHSDWLQSLAELGYVGTGLLVLTGAVPLYARRRTLGQSALGLYLLGGCTALVLYSAVEFPFGNGAVIPAFWVCYFTAVHYGWLADRGASGRPAAAATGPRDAPSGA